MTRDRLIALLASHSGREPASIGPLQTLAGDLDLDSLDRLDLRLAIEDTFSIDITDAELDRPELGTVGGLRAFVEDRLKASLELVELAVATPDWAKSPIVVNARPPAGKCYMLNLKPSFQNDWLIPETEMFALQREERQTFARLAFDAGVRAGRCDPNPAAAWQAFKEEHGL